MWIGVAARSPTQGAQQLAVWDLACTFTASWLAGAARQGVQSEHASSAGWRYILCMRACLCDMRPMTCASMCVSALIVRVQCASSEAVWPCWQSVWPCGREAEY